MKNFFGKYWSTLLGNLFSNHAKYSILLNISNPFLSDAIKTLRYTLSPSVLMFYKKGKSGLNIPLLFRRKPCNSCR